MSQHIGNIGLLNLINATEESIKGIEKIDNVGMVVFKSSKAALLQHLSIGNIGTTIEIPDGYGFYQGDMELNAAYLQSIAEPLKLVVSGNVTVDKEVQAENLQKNLLKLIVKGEVYCPSHLAGQIHSFLLEESRKIMVYDGGAPRVEKGALTLTNTFLNSLSEPVWLIFKGAITLAGDLDMELFMKKISKLEVKGEMILFKSQEPFVLRKMESLSKFHMEVIPDEYELVEKELAFNGRSIRHFHHKKFWTNEPVIFSADVTRVAFQEAIDGIHSSSFIVCAEELEDLIYEKCVSLETEVLTFKHQFILIEGEETWSNDQFLGLSRPVNIVVTGSLILDEDVTAETLADKVLSIDLYGDAFVPNAKVKGKVRSLLRANEGLLKVPSDKKKQPEFRNIGQLSL